MTVFKGFMTITKKNLSISVTYLGVFLTIMIISMKADSGSASEYKQHSLDIGVIDCDGGKLAGGLSDYLEQYHHLTALSDDKAEQQDSLFFRRVSYIIRIPENFEADFLTDGQKLSVTKIPGSSSGYYVDQQVNTYLNQINALTSEGFSVEEAVTLVGASLPGTESVTLSAL